MNESLWCGLSLKLPSVALHGDGGAPIVSTIQLSRVGSWVHPVYGILDFNPARYARFIANFDANVRGVDPALDVEHVPTDGAAAWFVPKSMRVEETDKGPGLFVDVRWTPRGYKLVKDQEYRYVSLTFKPTWTDPETGHVFQDVVFGAALTTDPFIKGMEPVHLSASAAGPEEIVMLADFDPVDVISTEQIELSESEEPKKMAQTAEAMRTAPFADDKQKLAGTTQQACPECDGSGKTDGDAACPECKGTGKIDVPATSLSDAPKPKKPEALDDDGGGADAMSDDASAEALAENYKAAGEKLAECLKGQTGTPMVRQHMAASHKLMNPILEKMKAKGEPAKMSDTETVQNPDFVKLHERLLAEEEKNRQNTIELSRLRTEKQRDGVVKLTESWFPRQGEAGFRCKSGDRAQIVDLLMELSAVDNRENEQLVKLSEGATVPDDKRSKLMHRVIALVENIPEPLVLNLSSKAVGLLDSEQDLTDERTRMAVETHKLSATENVPFHVAARNNAGKAKRR